ncbi:class I SAM-dependent methyltransferase [Chitinophaga sp. 22620]|uniref:class I SAM-dependent methyltransferase n=1 Tax=Chitinophaga sp. 22620 TaxID=3453952 RepID=UPI003F8767C6
MPEQKKAFQEYEADQWFLRNKSYLDNYDARHDIVLNTVQNYKLHPENILEIGCSAGHRLNSLKKLFPGATVCGIDPSQQAVSYGAGIYPGVELTAGTADQMKMFADGQFDLVIVGFVFYVIDRPLLLQVIAEIDRVLADKGVLVIVDFFSERTIKNHYQHITEFQAYSYKQNYDRLFTETALYHLLFKGSFDHSTGDLDSSDDYYNKCSISLLKKDIYAAYNQ